MQQTKTLVIMAAGLGSRFGKLKQLHAILSDHTIMDYSIYDALTVGFNRIVIIVKKDVLSVFEKRYKNKFDKDISIVFIIQDNVVSINGNLKKRLKPWGTGHALLTLKNVISDPFAIINADDFYGKDAFSLMHEALFFSNTQNNYFIGYPVNKTLSESGPVSRGMCFLDDNNTLNKIIECTKISKSLDNVISYIDEKNRKTPIEVESIVSMNFWGFTPDIFSIAEPIFEDFLKVNSKSTTAEFYLPNIVDYSIQKKIKSYKMLLSNEKWLGITYKEDEKVVSKAIKKLVNQGLYPENLWTKK